MIGDIDLATMSQAICLRLSYYEAISYANILAESSIRYPVAEYLERRLSYKTIILEFDNPIFKRKKCDLYVERIKEGVDLKDMTVFEFKYVKDRTAYLFQDYYDDILRLHYLHEMGMQALFIVSGNPINFNGQFRSIKRRTTQLENKKGLPSGAFSRVLSFSFNKPAKVFNANKKEYKKNYKEFTDHYIFRDEVLIHPSILNIQTRLVCLKLNEGQHSVGIWEVL